jgi:hypothetical protein
MSLFLLALLLSADPAPAPKPAAPAATIYDMIKALNEIHGQQAQLDAKEKALQEQIKAENKKLKEAEDSAGVKPEDPSPAPPAPPAPPVPTPAADPFAGDLVKLFASDADAANKKVQAAALSSLYQTAAKDVKDGSMTLAAVKAEIAAIVANNQYLGPKSLKGVRDRVHDEIASAKDDRTKIADIYSRAASALDGLSK